MKKILLLEDDKTLGSSLQERLSQIYIVDWASTIQKARELITNSHQTGAEYDLAILDAGLPDGSGFDFAKEIKKHSLMDFLFLTAQSDAEHRLLGFEIGAVEFIPKPFHLKELLMRVDHVMRDHIPVMKEFEFADGFINFEEQKITYKDGRIEFPAMNELKLLKLLIQNTPKIFSRDEIIDALWGQDKVPSPRSIDNMIVHLRHLLGPDGEHIKSVRGVGYQYLIQEKP